MRRSNLAGRQVAHFLLRFNSLDTHFRQRLQPRHFFSVHRNVDQNVLHEPRDLQSYQESTDSMPTPSPRKYVAGNWRSKNLLESRSRPGSAGVPPASVAAGHQRGFRSACAPGAASNTYSRITLPGTLLNSPLPGTNG